VLTGRGRLADLRADRAAGLAEVAAARSEARESWARAAETPPQDAVLLPSRLMTTIHLGEPTLSDFSAGRSRLEPTTANIRLATRPDALFARYQVGNSESAFRGEIDLAFITLVLAPLLLIGLGYGVFTTDRESGLARLWLAQAGSPLKLLAVRSLNRIAIVFAPVLLAGLTLWLIGPDMAQRAGPVAAWLGVALLGLLFWWALVLLVNSFARAAETAALILIGCWTLFVFVVPTAVTAGAGLINPPPSRFEQIAAARATEVRASREYDNDHPELSTPTLEGRRATVEKGIEVRRLVADAVRPLTERYDAQLEAQRRTLQWTQLLSPTAVSGEALAGVARTDAGFYAAQREAAADYLAPLSTALADAALGRQPISATTFDALPRFTPPAPAPTPVWPILWVAFVTLILTIWAVARLRRVSPL
jgi:ABC-2 type transport system permease protein